MKIFTEFRYLIDIMYDTYTCTVVHLERNELSMCIYQDKRSFNYTVFSDKRYNLQQTDKPFSISKS